jgi:hypothetical protein
VFQKIVLRVDLKQYQMLLYANLAGSPAPNDAPTSSKAFINEPPATPFTPLVILIQYLVLLTSADLAST